MECKRGALLVAGVIMMLWGQTGEF